jgi:serine carboxypeptidase-like clade II
MFDPCLQEYTTVYLNHPEVQQAIHARPTNWSWVSRKLNYQNETASMFAAYSLCLSLSVCALAIELNQLRLLDMIPLWQRFLAQTSWRILIYSGDVDSTVPFLDTQSWISCLNQPIIRRWRNWHRDRQTAGSIIEYKGITFLTVKGAGHMVPLYDAPSAWAFYSRWIQGQSV